ncbi:MAG: hypothetical protein JOS17DRAFT_760389 [Linnemannia elongata]|nr:MAG: hypothetical protein JOS17DRAFT_760389 [Linnemannia elongata]
MDTRYKSSPHAIALYFFLLLLFHFAVLVHPYKSVPFMIGTQTFFLSKGFSPIKVDGLIACSQHAGSYGLVDMTFYFCSQELSSCETKKEGRGRRDKGGEHDELVVH